MNIIVHMPTTTEGKENLCKRVAECQAKLIIDNINKQEMTLTQKEQLLDKVIEKLSGTPSGT